MPEFPAPDESVVDAEASDRSLLRRFRTGSEGAATEIYLRYATRLQALASSRLSEDLATRVDAEDIVQSVFRTFFRRVSKGDYDVPDGEELWKLFLVMGLNKIRSAGTFHRAAKRDVRSGTGGENLEQLAESGSAGDEVSLNILRMVIDDVLSTLPVTNREIIKLRIEGHEVESIADQLQRSKRTVERVLQEFRKKMSTLIGEDST